MFVKLRQLLVVVLTASLLGCAQPAPKPAVDGKLQVVASLYPLAWLTEQVGGNRVDVTNLVPPGAEPHDLELTARQVAAMARADLVVYEPHVAPAVDAGVIAAAPRHALDVTQSAGMMTVAQETADHADEAVGQDQHDHGLYDPHFWLDPTKMAAVAAAVAQQFQQIDPAHAAEYRSNLAQVSTELRTLDQQFRSGLAECQRHVFITTHAAFGYLAVRYHLTQIGVSGISPDEEPSPSRIADVHRLARAYQVTTIFSETLVSAAVAQTIAGDLNLHTDVLDPLEGITDQSRGTEYLSVMRSNLAALRSANGCS